jgi:hypothetical protein
MITLKKIKKAIKQGKTVTLTDRKNVYKLTTIEGLKEIYLSVIDIRTNRKERYNLRKVKIKNGVLKFNFYNIDKVYLVAKFTKNFYQHNIDNNSLSVEIIEIEIN